MKFEDFIKNKVEHHEEVYDPTAWSKLSAKMDVAPKGIHPTTTTNLKWWIAASVATIALVSGFIFMNNKSTKSATEKTPVVSKKESVEQPAKENKETNTVEKEQRQTIAHIQPQGTAIKVKEEEVLKVNSSETVKSQISQNSTNTETDYGYAIEGTETSFTNNKTPKNTKAITAFAIPEKICKGKNFTVTNENNELLIVKSADNTLKVEAKQTLSTGTLAAGNYTVALANGKKVQHFEIVDTPKLDFVADNMVYEKGLPFVPVRLVNNDLYGYEWKLNNQTLSTKKDVLVPAFNKGGVKITFNGLMNGCQVNDAYLVTVNDDYNLLAVTAFNIDSRDERNRTFLPYALYDRTEEFEMQIIDPKNNEVIFTSHSSTEPWNGIDNRTGELVAPNTRYIWTVRLSEKANYETKAVYQGVIVRVTF